jgi:hypothetical protein
VISWVPEIDILSLSTSTNAPQARYLLFRIGPYSIVIIIMQSYFTPKELSRFGPDKQLINFNVLKETYIVFGAKMQAFKQYGPPPTMLLALRYSSAVLIFFFNYTIIATYYNTQL